MTCKLCQDTGWIKVFIAFFQRSPKATETPYTMRCVCK
jgi:hypothetical protein